jgi:hypothetical protein
MRINVFFAQQLRDAVVVDSDIIGIPDSLADRLESIVKSFFKWIHV